MHLKWKLFGCDRSLLFKLLSDINPYWKITLLPTCSAWSPWGSQEEGWKDCRLVFCLLLLCLCALSCSFACVFHFAFLYSFQLSSVFLLSSNPFLLLNCLKITGGQVALQRKENVDVNVRRSSPLSSFFHCCLLIPSTFRYSVLSPEQTWGYLGLGATIKRSLFPVWVLWAKIPF